MPYEEILTALFLTVELLALWSEHYDPHMRELTGLPLDDPKRLQINYVLGDLAIFVPYTLWLVVVQPGNPFYIAFMTWVFLGSGGAMVHLMYRRDAWIKHRQDARDDKEKLALLESRRDAESQRQ